MDQFTPKSSNKQSSVVPLPRGSRESLEVFNPSTYATRPINPAFRANQTWQSWVDQEQPHESPKSVPSANSDQAGEITSWMALKDPSPPQPIPLLISSPEATEKLSGEAGIAAKRAAEWGLVLKAGKPQGVGVRASVGDEPNVNKTGTSRRNSNNSVRSSGELYEDEGGNRGIPRISEDIKDALSSFQQTFVVSIGCYKT